MEAADISLLWQIPLFAGAPEERLQALTTWRFYRQREVIVGPGEEHGDVFVLADGKARVYGANSAGAGTERWAT